MLAQRLRRWPSIKTSFFPRVIFAGYKSRIARDYSDYSFVYLYLFVMCIWTDVPGTAEPGARHDGARHQPPAHAQRHDAGGRVAV